MPFVEIGPGPIDYERIEHGGPGSHTRDVPTIVMLHEGVGSISIWRDFPTRLARATRTDVIVFSRHGYGHSARLKAPRDVRYMHHEALVVLPQFLDEIGIENPILLGHSDGGSIALIHAGGSGRKVAGVVVVAPHVLVEDISISGIVTAKRLYETTNLRERLARHHDDVDGAFWGWNDIWLSAAFRSWNIEEYLPRIACPVLAIQGEQDEYGTMDQLERIARGASTVEQVRLPHCGHSPHRDQPAALLDAIPRWLRLHREMA